MAIVVDRKTKLTYQDYLQFPEDGRRHEVIDGDHYVSAASFVPHQRLLKKLLRQLCRHIEDTGLGEVRGSRVLDRRRGAPCRAPVRAGGRHLSRRG